MTVAAPLSDEERRRFDALLEEVLAELPEELLARFEEIPLIVEDAPSAQLMRQLGVEQPEHLCGLHTGVALTERSVELSGVPTDEIRIFRRGVLAAAGGRLASRERLLREIRITVLHELGHHFGLDERDLEALGYG
ncbi:MAG: metallopeptidase family protein [Planctomycetota bacterium]|nr:MAG: metallopeptidase family protein [Planctomycetota bacterium]